MDFVSSGVSSGVGTLGSVQMNCLCLCAFFLRERGALCWLNIPYSSSVCTACFTCSCTDLLELLAGEVPKLRRVRDLVLSLVLEFLPLVLEVRRDATTAGETEKTFIILIKCD